MSCAEIRSCRMAAAWRFVPEGAGEPENAALRSHLIHLDLFDDLCLDALAPQLKDFISESRHYPATLPTRQQPKR